MAVWRLSKELDFFKPRVGPSSTGVDGAGGQRGTQKETDRGLESSLDDLYWKLLWITNGSMHVIG